MQAQSLEANISVLSLSPARLKIEGQYSVPTTVWSFPDTYAGILGLGGRVENFELLNSAGAPIAVQKLAPGQFRSVENAIRFKYEVMLGEPRPSQMAHISWLNEKQGFLMLADLLPFQEASEAVVGFKVPEGWTVASALKADREARYSVKDSDKAVFIIGESLREQRRRIKSTELIVVVSGEWPVAESDVIKVAEKLVRECLELTGSPLNHPAMIMLAPLPEGAGPGSWRAEARGSNVALILGRQARRSDILARVGVILSHELLHLWVPNALQLEGDYDWFFEGFTVYQALRIAQRTGLIRFNEYLDTIARVYDSYLATPDRDRFSLIEASERRWTTSSPLVYDKGMLVALLCDLMIRNSSNNKRSLDQLYRELFRSSEAGGRSDANAAIISLLAKEIESDEIVKDLIVRPGRIQLDVALEPFGFMLTSAGRKSKLQVAPDLTARQRNLLRSLGYKG